MDNRAQGLGLNVIILSAIGLVVLVVLTFVILDSTERFEPLDQCSSFAGGVEGQDYQCVPEGAACPDGMNPDNSRSCSQESLRCCVNV